MPLTVIRADCRPGQLKYSTARSNILHQVRLLFRGSMPRHIVLPAGELIIAFKGSTSLEDWTNTNIPLSRGQLPQSFNAAREFVLAARQEFNERYDAPPGNTILTGHSKGAAEAQWAAVQLINVIDNLKAATFAGPGIEHLLRAQGIDINSDPALAAKLNDSIVNFVNNGDPIELANRLFGMRRVGTDVYVDSNIIPSPSGASQNIPILVDSYNQTGSREVFEQILIAAAQRSLELHFADGYRFSVMSSSSGNLEFGSGVVVGSLAASGNLPSFASFQREFETSDGAHVSYTVTPGAVGWGATLSMQIQRDGRIVENLKAMGVIEPNLEQTLEIVRSQYGANSSLIEETRVVSEANGESRTLEYTAVDGTDVVAVWVRPADAAADLSGALTISTASLNGDVGGFAFTNGARAPILGADGTLTFDLGVGSAVIDPAAGMMAATVGGTAFSIGAGTHASASVDASGAAVFALGEAGLVTIGVDGHGNWSIGNGLTVSLPVGAQVAQDANGAFSVTTPSGTEAYVTAPNGTVVALPLGGTFVLAPTSNDGLVARFGYGRSVTLDAQGGLSLGIDGLPSVDIPEGGVNSLENFFEEQGLALNPVAAYVAATSGAGTDTPSLPTSTVDIGLFNDWLDDRVAAESAAQDGTNFAVVADPSLLPLYDANIAAWNNASDEEIIAHLNALSKSGVAQQAASNPTLEQTWQNIAEALGMQDEPGGKTAGKRLSDFMGSSQAALGVISSLKSAIEKPTIRAVAGAAHQLVTLGIQFDPGMKADLAEALGLTYELESPDLSVDVLPDIRALNGLLAGVGAGLSVIAAIENPTPSTVFAASNQVLSAIDSGLAIPGASAIAAAIGFVENPNPQSGINAALWTAAWVNPPVFLPVAIAYSVINTVVSIFGGGKPIVLDMDGDGVVELTPVDASTAFYDLDGDGWREHRGWVGGGDGLLAIDANGDGFITGRDELSFLGYKEGARTDLEGLVAFDSNNDGKLSALDQHWGRFRVWIDADSDGFADTGELRSLAEAGVAEIGLAHSAPGGVSGGNEVFGYGSFKMADGSVRNFADAKFGTDAQIARSVPGEAKPLVFNLVGNAVHTIAASAVDVSFDMDANGTRERTAWIAPDQAFLFSDSDKDGKVDDASELIGGFEQLATLDFNHDGKIDSADAAFQLLRLWIDKNMDGQSSANEIYTLAPAWYR